MAIRAITKESWPEIKKYLSRDGWRFISLEIERLWEQADKMHEIVYALTEKVQKLEEENYWLKKNQK